ncbi:hypothetical protein [Amycolatopsis sp. NPDC003731]
MHCREEDHGTPPRTRAIRGGAGQELAGIALLRAAGNAAIAGVLAPRALQRFATTDVADVRSLQMEEFSQNLDHTWAGVGKKLARRDSILAARAKLVKPASPTAAALGRLQARWSGLRKLLAGSSTPATSALPGTIDADIADEKSDLKGLTAKADKPAAGEAAEFLKTLSRFLADRKKLDDEDTEFHRFDADFTAADVDTLVKAIAGGSFHAAEVKAITGQETGDLTNTTVAGITRKKAGITTKVPNPGTFTGLGQHSTGSAAEAITWAAGQGVTIPPKPDPRTVPAESIKLTAAYLGREADLLVGALPAPHPSGDEFKKLVFAAYNGGHSNVVKAAKEFQAAHHGAGATPYTWNDIKKSKRISGQMRGYVEGVSERLS